MSQNLNLLKNKAEELPNNIEAEQSVIGSILLSNEIFDEVNLILSSKNFYDPIHRKIFQALEQLIYGGMLANPITLKNYFDKEKEKYDTDHSLWLKFSLTVSTILILLYFIFPSQLIEVVSRINII